MEHTTLSWKDEADLALDSLLSEYGIAGIREEAVNIFYGDYILLKIKWALDFVFIAFLFIFSGVFLWFYTPVQVEIETAFKVVLELGLFRCGRYIWNCSFDKKAVDTTKKFVALANRYPEYFVKNLEEETTDGNEGNADKTE